MTRILVQRGSSSSNSNRTSLSSQPQTNISPVTVVKEDETGEEVQENLVVDVKDDFAQSFDDDEDDDNAARANDLSLESFVNDQDKDKTTQMIEVEKRVRDEDLSTKLTTGIGDLTFLNYEGEGSGSGSICGTSHPPPPPVPPPKPSSGSLNSRRIMLGGSNSPRVGSPRRAVAWPVVPTKSSPTGSRPSSPRSHGETEGYNSADEQSHSFGSCYDDSERERQFEIEIRRAEGLDVRRMMEDGNCLFRAVADQVYGDCEGYDLVRQMCIDYMERERDHFSQFITEGFMSYCKRKRRDKVYGNNVEIQALAEMYNRPIHIYSYSTEPINIFQGLGFSSLRGRNADKDQVKAAIKAQQDQQIDNALLAEGRLYSDLELTEKEIERMVMEASRAEYIADDNFKQQLGYRESSTSNAEPSSSGARPSASEAKAGKAMESALSSSMQMVLSMGFSYLQAIEAYSIFGDDVDSMICYLLEIGNSSRRSKGKATE